MKREKGDKVRKVTHKTLRTGDLVSWGEPDLAAPYWKVAIRLPNTGIPDGDSGLYPFLTIGWGETDREWNEKELVVRRAYINRDTVKKI